MLDACLALLDTEEEKQRFTEVYHANKRLVHYVAYRVLGDEHLAEDVVQDVFLRLAENFTKLSQKGSHKLRAWCVITGRNRAIDLLRRRRELPAEPEERQTSPDPVPEDAVTALDNARRLMELVAALPDRYAAPLRLLAQGYTCPEIAAALDLTEAAVRQRVHRGRALLWKELNRDAEPHEP